MRHSVVAFCNRAMNELHDRDAQPGHAGASRMDRLDVAKAVVHQIGKPATRLSTVPRGCYGDILKTTVLADATPLCQLQALSACHES